MPNNRNTLKINILDLGKKKRKRHPAGGYYYGDSKNTPKRYQEPKPRVMNAWKILETTK